MLFVLDECSIFLGRGLGHSALLFNPTAAKRREMHEKTAEAQDTRTEDANSSEKIAVR